jgi:hypothetical protein
MVDKYVNAIKNFIPSLISLLAVFIVSRLIYELGGPAMGINDSPDVIGGVIKTIAVVAASSLLTVLAVTAIDSGK